jgi:hypothetical protein
MEKAKIGPWDLPRIAIISGNGALSRRKKAALLQRAVKTKMAWKEWRMAPAWKKFLFLDFEKSFLSSNAKLLLVLNPLWTLIVTLVLENHSITAISSNWNWGFFKAILASVLFRWTWNLTEATIVCLWGMGVIRIYLWMEKIWPLGKFQGPPRHGTGWYLLFLAFLAPPGLFLALRLMVLGINFLYAGDPMALTVPWQYYGTEIFWVWALLLVCFLFKSWQDLRDSAQQSQLRSEELEKERLQALLTKLKDQMNPHFLFNTLNTVASLIPADPAKAEQVIVKLSTLYQGVLTATRKTNHPLEKELEFCGNYLDIERTRFGRRLEASIEIEKGLDPARVQVPVLLLQPLVENSVKHGLSSRASGGHIWIKGRLNGGRVELSVEDDGVGFGNSPYSGSGTALENCRKRLELGFGTEGRMEILPRDGGGTVIRLTLPVLAAEPLDGGEG